MYEKLLADKNAETALALSARKDDLANPPPPPAKGKGETKFTTSGKLVFDALANKDGWKLEGSGQTTLTRNNLTIDLEATGPTDALVKVQVQEKMTTIALNADERQAIIDRAKGVKEDIVQSALQDATKVVKNSK